ncbi:MAG TPA: cell division protein FtsQ/DivIB [Candidatus Eisenbergiella intestinigallinarum]|uniref:Cell division protein FtsQ/DivIB n=1 Tax=Candidatus Eisenbergiella intestinigallinarum TaxID=2838549 RepID=A0A9D2QF33_9FIRM|nr:cell division protein FtsQ/DivIB [Candidatus Eisenbergiella intestinigallinarum]
MYDTRGLSAKGKNGLESLKRRSSRRRLIILSIFAGTAAVFAAAFLFILQYFHVENIYVEGNLHYTSDEIIEMVTGGRFGDNSLYLSLKYRDKGIQDIPFIQTMDVDVLSPDTIRIIVYEKSIAGYVEYLDRYMYFDRDGIVVEASATKTDGIPEITGIDFNQVVLYEALPVENQDVFREILSITQILSKYGLSADKIYFDDAGEMTLYFGDVRARLGSEENMEEKVGRLQQLLPSAEGKKGVFRLENYSGSGENVSFELDD